MNTYGKLTVALMAGCCMLQAGQALADDIITEFYSPDTSNSSTYFPGYSDTAYNTTDSIGNNPQVVGTLVTFDSTTGQLLSVTIMSETDMNPDTGWGFSSLFINTTGSGQDWNYFVHSGGIYGGNYVDGGATLPGNGLYSVSSGYTYTLVGDPQDGSIGRTGHPDGIVADDHLSSISTTFAPTYETGFSYAPAGISNDFALTYDFSGSSIFLQAVDGEFVYTIGWTPFCANDVVYFTDKEPQQPPAAVPEPMTMVLVGTGIATLAGWRNQKKNTKK